MEAGNDVTDLHLAVAAPGLGIVDAPTNRRLNVTAILMRLSQRI